MSATRDLSQKFGFVFTNLYEVYRNQPVEVTEPKVEDIKQTLERAKVIKAHDIHASPDAATQIKTFTPPVFKAKAAAPAPMDAVASLKNNLHKLNDLHERLQFMLKELEELSKKN